jgi:hypothetical protein
VPRSIPEPLTKKERVFWESRGWLDRFPDYMLVDTDDHNWASVMNSGRRSPRTLEKYQKIAERKESTVPQPKITEDIAIDGKTCCLWNGFHFEHLSLNEQTTGELGTYVTSSQCTEFHHKKRKTGIRATVTDPFPDSDISPEHAAFKTNMNDVFAQLIAKYGCSGENVVYLDGKEQRTTQALMHTDCKLFIANEIESTFNILKSNKRIFACLHESITNALLDSWKEVVFRAVYFDLCTGTFAMLKETLDAFFQESRGQYPLTIVGYTLTPRDCHGESLTKRLDQTENYLRSKGRILRAADMKEFENVIWTHNGVVTRFVVLENFD